MGKNPKRVFVLKHPVDLSVLKGNKGRKSVVSFIFFFLTCSLPPISLFYLANSCPYLDYCICIFMHTKVRVLVGTSFHPKITPYITLKDGFREAGWKVLAKAMLQYFN